MVTPVLYSREQIYQNVEMFAVQTRTHEYARVKKKGEEGVDD